jgi:hypothetical protein
MQFMENQETSKKIEDGGPAFPMDGSLLVQDGMSLRDYFAAKAMVGLLSSEFNNAQAETQFIYHADDGLTWNHSSYPESLAKLSYQLSDAMLAERLK